MVKKHNPLSEEISMESGGHMESQQLNVHYEHTKDLMKN